jgi:hypothetical protein
MVLVVLRNVLDLVFGFRYIQTDYSRSAEGHLCRYFYFNNLPMRHMDVNNEGVKEQLLILHRGTIFEEIKTF